MRRFHLFPYRIYANDPLWVPPLLPDRMKQTDNEKGMFFKRGEAAFFMAYRGSEPVGTICAAMDPSQIEEYGRRECIFGFFQTVDDREVADALFARVEAWARERDLESLVGPFDLDYEDAYGILIYGRDRPPVVMCGHTPEYYQRIVEHAGFVPTREPNIAMAVDIANPPPEIERLGRMAELARKRGGFEVRAARLDDWDAEIDRIQFLLNNSLTANNTEGIPWPREAVEELANSVRRIIDPEIVLFADRTREPDAGKTVGWFAGVANVNEILIHANGLRYPWNYLSLLLRARKQPACLAVKSLLVLPEYHSSGVAALLFDEMRVRGTKKGYSWIDLSLTSEGNPQTPIIAERAGARIYKRYQVYRRPIARAGQ